MGRITPYIRRLPHHDLLVEYLHYDPDTGIFTWRKDPRGAVTGGLVGRQAGSQDSNGRWSINFLGQNWPASRLAWKWMTGHDPKGFVDHENMDPSDNRWRNLRDLTCAQNTSSRYPINPRRQLPVGISPASRGRYRAVFKIDGLTILNETFNTVEEAVAAREHWMKMFVPAN